jgi:hypothetical protein
MFAEGDIADELGGEIDVATGGDLGQSALVAADHVFEASRESLEHCLTGAGERSTEARRHSDEPESLTALRLGSHLAPIRAGVGRIKRNLLTKCSLT